ncbi:MAG: transglycosylase SLT domain-containing protein [Sulfuricurvum sp.]|jgi:soluble lytic murein transglycosylase|uniref:transglycosylase SLT domain-containing protein n=1 Tax=Sulfuricurvum sp. TaxID=2025608 RepID=UPI0025DA0FC5|nr:transglycosylase SLT domain-containing protein [Sulfuricurvum sp.]MCK9372913.1 transglycosylase SLT domain-containing protein [Sulfuricurvum sp.]
MKGTLLLSALLASHLFGVTLNDINGKPASREKNFLIWQFLHQDINASDASDAFYQIDSVNERFLADYAKKTDELEIRYTVECLQKPLTALKSIEEDDCLMLALSPAKAQELRNDERETIAARLETRFANLEWLRTMNQEYHFGTGSDLKSSLKLFLITTPPYRQEHFNHLIDEDTLSTLTALSGFNQLVYLTATDPKMDQLQYSLAKVSGGSYDSMTHFYLAVNALKYGRNDNALYHLQEAKKKVKSPMEKDKVTFWLYRLTRDESTLQELAESLDINMYTLYAKERFGIETENYFTTLPTSRRGGFRGDEPFEWNRLHREIVATPPEKLYQLVERYEGEESLAVQAYMIERVYQPYVHNFTMPYEPYLEGVNNEQKAMIYALMRQETQMIPGLISRSFALGLMQIMPFNVDAIAKNHPLKITSYNDMFDPKYNIPYAIEHLKHIEKNLFNPVFMAYAYNGGIGFTKRLIMSEGMFLPGEYEPFMSMELVGNAESREYGKRVLANYVIFKKILGEKVSISAIFDTLTQPSRSDYFRAEALKISQGPSQTE